MKLDVRAAALSGAVFWGFGAMGLTGLFHLAGGYGGAFLEVMASLYPGYHPGGGLAQLALGTLYGLVDGAVSGFALAWLYNVLART